MTIQSINNNEQLSRIRTLLETSYGESIDLKDEMDYFNAIKPKYWYVGIKKNKAVGFIRHFRVGTEDLVELELYANDPVVKKALLAYFVQEWDKCTSTAVRICLQKREADLIAFVLGLSFERNKTYLEWHYTVMLPISKSNEALIRFAISSPSEIFAIQNILWSEFGLIQEETLSRRVQDEQIIVLINNDELVGVCVLSAHEIQREIIQIVIAGKHRRKGFGKLLLEQTMLLYREKMPKLQFKLRVKEGNKAAINLYQSIGFKHVSSEYWLLRKK